MIRNISSEYATQLEYEFGEDFRRDYSGRGMYGKTCIGIVSDEGSKHFVEVLAELIAQDRFIDDFDDGEVGDIIEEIGEPTTDSMGLSVVYYWPRISVQD